MSLLPVQLQSFVRINSGKDTILQSPTGSGKTLAFVLPLVSNLRRSNSKREKVARPLIITMCPSRELARQVGKEYSKFTAKSIGAATVFGGVPLERHAAMLQQNPQVLTATVGRLRELAREGHLDYSHVRTVVLDEADALLDDGDAPDAFSVLRDIETALGQKDPDAEYQVVMVSATPGKSVRAYAKELEFDAGALVRVDALVREDTPVSNRPPRVRHHHLSCKSSARASVTSGLLSVFSPRSALVFVPTKTEAERVAASLSRNGHASVLHGDMSQAARSRCVALFREEGGILVATDVASRGLDLPNVDLVVQFGIPTDAGRKGTFDPDLYVHRTGRAGRVGGVKGREDPAAVLLYDPAQGEGKLIPPLLDSLDVDVRPMSIPSTKLLADKAYQRASSAILRSEPSHLVDYFLQELRRDLDASDSDLLLRHLATAMVASSGMDPSAHPTRPQSSLLTGDPSARTLRLCAPDSELTPPLVTKFCKSRASGKLGRVYVCLDGSAVFDLPEKRAEKLLRAVELEPDSPYRMEMASVVPEIS